MSSNGTGRKAPPPSSASKPKNKVPTSTPTSRTASPTPNNSNVAKDGHKDSPQSQQPGGDGSSGTKLCKHCKQEVDAASHAAHSKKCLRERKRKKEQEKAAAEAKANGESATAKEKDVKEEPFSRAGTVAADDSLLPSAAASSLGEGETIDGSKEGKKSKKLSLGASDNKKKQNKKRKAEEAPAGAGDKDKPPTKKKKKDANGGSAGDGKAKTGGGSAAAAKPKMPVDVEKQCGVDLGNGAKCARSLTCKSHTMGAKRAVPGRSLPYDTLLAQYQRKNQAKQQKAALANSQPVNETEGGPNAGGPVDSEEEREVVMAGIARAAPRPLIERIPISVADRYRHVRLKEMVSQALGGSRGGGLFLTTGLSNRNAPGGTGSTSSVGT